MNKHTPTTEDQKCITTLERRMDHLAKRVAFSSHGSNDYDKKELKALKHLLDKFV
jgi:hypothetical protein